ncbi:MAG: hypothetical protein AB7T06_46540 [Kofleriaceae bacterium]
MSDLNNEPSEELRAAWEALQSAVRQFNANIPIEARCVFCENVLEVEGVPPNSPTQWFVRCPCGKSNATIKGV